MSSLEKKRHSKKKDLYDADADQPEVMPDAEEVEKPEQAEGDREIVEEDLKEKDLSDDDED